ncbi:hypothetical protein [Staphylococcus chromogenes]|uniref:hypothetical protein n=1 Tax=Staphylococcus chromogenes TaxID=46126 RepID=UPI001C3CACBC|nr:hypothetical protein [Staphylococcus chromogenes]MBV5190399.1 hypothetical protein [Staphylococcus chromogenes]MBW3132693.1 hypothetical protein [Staphylococcus chromogenes]MCD8905030.1 hypothetical protein [Staphylococcus chromogenes]
MKIRETQNDITLIPETEEEKKILAENENEIRFDLVNHFNELVKQAKNEETTTN